jgi:hypothetical protein
MVADVAVTPLEATALMVGIAAGVENVKFAEVAMPAEFAEMAAKL